MVFLKFSEAKSSVGVDVLKYVRIFDVYVASKNLDRLNPGLLKAPGVAEKSIRKASSKSSCSYLTSYLDSTFLINFALESIKMLAVRSFAAPARRQCLQASNTRLDRNICAGTINGHSLH